jgi:hypothetical protein
MTETLIFVLQKAADLGLQLSVKAPDTLNIEASRPWPKEFADVLKLHKSKLIALLRLPFVMVRSSTLGDEPLFFCADESTKNLLMLLTGAEPWSIYTKAELKILVEQNRVAPLSLEELARLHALKKTFRATIRE